MNAKAISEGGPGNQGCVRVLLSIFGLVFAGFGAGFIWLSFLLPLLNARAATSWPETKCHVISSKIESHRNSEGNTSYTPEIKYEFQLNGVTYTGERYSFSNLKGSHKRATAIVHQFPKGSQPICYYDPLDPSQCVLTRKFDAKFYWTVLFPLIFLVIGCSVLFFAISGKGFGKKQAISISGSTDTSTFNLAETKPSGDTRLDSTGLHRADAEDERWSTPQKLKTETSRLVMFFVLCGFAAFWNGILSIFLYGLITEWGGGWESILLMLFLVPFVVIGLILLGGVVYMFLAIFNPRFEVAMSRGAVPLGGDVDIAWDLIGSARRLRSLKLEIQGEQSATYRQGTDTRTDTEIFEIVPIKETSDRAEMAFGSATVRIPESTMHTFEADRNKITWSIVLKGDIPWWPDVSETFPFRVTPGSNES